MQESVVEIFETFGGLVVYCWEVEKECKNRGTRGEVGVNWDVVEVVIKEVERRGYESKDIGGERHGL